MTVISANRFLTRTEQEGNATYIYQWLLGRGWTPQAIAGTLGNMETESTMNPGIWQNLDEGNYSGGFGLVQWTPATKYIDWAIERSLPQADMDSNLLRVIYEVEQNIQWINGSMTFAQFTQSTLTPYECAVLFLHSYERPASPNDAQRGSQATAWYNLLSGLPPITGTRDTTRLHPALNRRIHIRRRSR